VLLVTFLKHWIPIWLVVLYKVIQSKDSFARTHSSIATLMCYFATPVESMPAARDESCSTRGEIRVMGIVTNTTAAGHLEMCEGSKWRTVCDQNWNTEIAAVACRQLGFSQGRQYGLHHFIRLFELFHSSTL